MLKLIAILLLFTCPALWAAYGGETVVKTDGKICSTKAEEKEADGGGGDGDKEKKDAKVARCWEELSGDDDGKNTDGSPAADGTTPPASAPSPPPASAPASAPAASANPAPAASAQTASAPDNTAGSGAGGGNNSATSSNQPTRIGGGDATASPPAATPAQAAAAAAGREPEDLNAAKTPPTPAPTQAAAGTAGAAGTAAAPAAATPAQTAASAPIAQPAAIPSAQVTTSPAPDPAPVAQANDSTDQTGAFKERYQAGVLAALNGTLDTNSTDQAYLQGALDIEGQILAEATAAVDNEQFQANLGLTNGGDGDQDQPQAIFTAAPAGQTPDGVEAGPAAVAASAPAAAAPSSDIDNAADSVAPAPTSTAATGAFGEPLAAGGAADTQVAVSDEEALAQETLSGAAANENPTEEDLKVADSDAEAKLQLAADNKETPKAEGDEKKAAEKAAAEKAAADATKTAEKKVFTAQDLAQFSKHGKHAQDFYAKLANGYQTCITPGTICNQQARKLGLPIDDPKFQKEMLAHAVIAVNAEGAVSVGKLIDTACPAAWGGCQNALNQSSGSQIKLHVLKGASPEAAQYYGANGSGSSLALSPSDPRQGELAMLQNGVRMQIIQSKTGGTDPRLVYSLNYNGLGGYGRPLNSNWSQNYVNNANQVVSAITGGQLTPSGSGQGIVSSGGNTSVVNNAGAGVAYAPAAASYSPPSYLGGGGGYTGGGSSGSSAGGGGGSNPLGSLASLFGGGGKSSGGGGSSGGGSSGGGSAAVPYQSPLAGTPVPFTAPVSTTAPNPLLTSSLIATNCDKPTLGLDVILCALAKNQNPPPVPATYDCSTPAARDILLCSAQKTAG